MTRCQCGQWSDVPCDAALGADAVTIEFMPRHLRSHHEAVGNRGTYPANGAVRIRVAPECADLMRTDDSEWCHLINPETR